MWPSVNRKKLWKEVSLIINALTTDNYNTDLWGEVLIFRKYKLSYFRGKESSYQQLNTTSNVPIFYACILHIMYAIRNHAYVHVYRHVH